jgi:large subunit ribosomal protein L20
MARTKGGIKNAKRRRNILRQAKGFRFARSTKKRAAIDALRHAGKYAFRDRRNKKREMRRLHTIRINAALRERGFKNYSTFIHALKKSNVELDRKVLSEIAMQYSETFTRILKKIS